MTRTTLIIVGCVMMAVGGGIVAMDRLKDDPVKVAAARRAFELKMGIDPEKVVCDDSVPYACSGVLQSKTVKFSCGEELSTCAWVNF